MGEVGCACGGWSRLALLSGNGAAESMAGPHIIKLHKHIAWTLTRLAHARYGPLVGEQPHLLLDYYVKQH